MTEHDLLREHLDQCGHTVSAKGVTLAGWIQYIFSVHLQPYLLFMFKALGRAQTDTSHMGVTSFSFPSTVFNPETSWEVLTLYGRKLILKEILLENTLLRILFIFKLLKPVKFSLFSLN